MNEQFVHVASQFWAYNLFKKKCLEKIWGKAVDNFSQKFEKFENIYQIDENKNKGEKNKVFFG